MVSCDESMVKEVTLDYLFLFIIWLKNPWKNAVSSNRWYLQIQNASKANGLIWGEEAHSWMLSCGYLSVWKTRAKLLCVGDTLFPKLCLEVCNNKLPFTTANNVNIIAFLWLIWMPINLLFIFSEVHSTTKKMLGYF